MEPPELSAGTVHPTCDQYGLALIYHELLTGAADRGRQPELDLLPPVERDVVGRALSPDPQRRYPSCRAFAEALAGADRSVSAERSLTDTTRTAGAALAQRRASMLRISPLSVSRTL